MTADWKFYATHKHRREDNVRMHIIIYAHAKPLIVGCIAILEALSDVL